MKTTRAIVGAVVAMSLAANAVMAQQAGAARIYSMVGYSLAEAMKPLLANKMKEKQMTSIPFAESLRRADVEVATMKDGQRESLILGNGDLYGIVWEKDKGLFMRITKNDIWDARVDTSKDGDLPRVDPVTREVTGLDGAPPSYALPYPQPRCAVAVRLGPVPEKMSGHLNLEKALVSIRSGEQPHTALRILYQQNVLLIRGPQPVVLEEIKAPTLPAAKLGETEGVSWLLMNLPGDLDYKGMDYAAAVATRGDLKAVSLVTSFDPGSGDVLTRAIALARQAVMEKDEDVVARHEQAWHDYWARCGVELADKTMERWWYRMLYFAGTVCRPGAAPVPILPPLATDKTPWHADFHHNYNTWQAYWPLPAANHPELADPWISYNLGMIPRYKNLAKVTYGLDGLHVPISSFLHEPDPANCKSKNQRQMSMNPWGLTIGLQAMTLQNMWQKYLCDQDVAYMKAKIYPFLREVATFYVALMEKCQRDDKGKVRLGPSYSPEHGQMGIFNCPFDIAYVHYTFDAMIEAATTLKIDGELAGKCREFKKLLPDYPTTQRNGEQIVVDWVGGDYIAEHNITVPAAPVFPADQVTWFSDEAQKKLFRQTIQQTRFRDANAHMMFNIARARLSMPEGYTEGRRWYASRELPNGLFVWAGHGHGTFMGEMIGIAGLINEYLLQSVGNPSTGTGRGIIRLFPCWPADQDAAFSRMRAQGGFIVSASFKNGRVEAATVESVADKQLVLLSPWKTMQVNGEPVEINEDGLVVIDTRPGDVLVLSEGKRGQPLAENGPSVEQALADPAAARLAKPTPGQIEWADMAQQMFVHFGIATWKGQEYDRDGQFDLSKVNPKGFDPAQLCAVAKSFGAKQIILVCKHVGGFCWWPTETTDYCVRNIPWKDGKGNLVKEVADACRQNGLKMGVYIYSDDARYSKGIGRGGRTDDPAKQEEWSQKLRQQWTEVLTLCGPDLVREVWFDGGCIVPLRDILDKLAPNAEIFGGPVATLRWPGTESGKLPYPCWSSIDTGVNSDGEGTGSPDGARWCPPECDTVLYGRGGHNWFWSAKNESRRHTLDELMDIYLNSVGRGGVLLLNSTPNTDGLIPADDVKRFQEFGAEIQRRFGKPVARTSGVGETVELDFGGLRKVNQAWIMEDARGGHRIRGYELEGRDAAGHWQPLATGISVGHKRIEVFPETTVDRLRLRITKHVGTPIIRELAACHAESVSVAADAPAVAKPVPCGKWAAGVERVTFDLTPHIKLPATYEISLCPGAEPIKIRSAKLLFNSSEMPADDCVAKDGKVIVRQTQQVTAQTKTELMLEFDPGAPAGEATIRMTSES